MWACAVRACERVRVPVSVRVREVLQVGPMRACVCVSMYVCMYVCVCVCVYMYGYA